MSGVEGRPEGTGWTAIIALAIQVACWHQMNMSPYGQQPLTRRANHFPIIRNITVCPALRAKIFCFSEIANHSRIVAILTRQEGRFANVSNAGQVAVGVGSFIDDWSHLRTAKPWGPDTPTLVSSLRDAIPGSDG